MARLIGYLKVIGREDQPTLMVRIGTSWYEMSRNANMPNGVCVYSGEDADNRHLNQHGVPYTGDLSQGMVKQIMAIMQHAHNPLIEAATSAVRCDDAGDAEGMDKAVEATRQALDGLGLLKAKS